MVDWLNLIFNTLWVIACALALAVLSVSSFQASQARQRLWSVLRLKTSQAWLSAAGFLFCAGLAGTSGSLLYRLIWLVLTVLFIVQLFIVLRAAH